MPASTPIYGIPYPCENENIDCSIFNAWASGMQTAIDSVRALETRALTRPSARATGINQAGFVAGANANLVYQTEVYDSDNIVDLAVNNSFFTIRTAGWYLFGCSVEMSNTAGVTSIAVGLAQNALFTFRRKMSSSGVNNNLTPGIQTIGLMRCAVGDIIQAIFTFTGAGAPVVSTVNTFGYMTTRL